MLHISLNVWNNFFVIRFLGHYQQNDQYKNYINSVKLYMLTGSIGIKYFFGIELLK